MSQWQFNATNQVSHTHMPFGSTKEIFVVAICSTAILLFALIFILINWVRKRGQTHHSTSNPNPLPPQTTLMIPQSLGLGEEAIGNLPVSVHRSFDIGGTSPAAECCICLSLFEEEDRVKVLPVCQHTYHSDCVDSWLGTQSSCPLCRVSLKKTPLAPHNFVNNV